MTHRLSWDGLWIDELIQAISDENDCLDIENQIQFPDQLTKVPLIVAWSQQEFTEIMSAVVNGAILNDPDNYQNIVATFFRIIGCSMDICTEVADCILNDETVLQNLITVLSQSGITPTSGNNPPSPISTSQSASNLLSASYVCDNDHLFGMARFIVQQLDSATRQLLNAIELITNAVEVAALLADNVEVVSWVGSGVELVAWFQDQLLEYYDASYTEAVEDELACALYCLMVENCELTVDMILDAYSDNTFGLPSNPEDINSVLDWLLDTTMSAEIRTVGTYHYFIAQAIRYSSNIGSIKGFRGLKLIVSLGEDETDADWSILCDCPSEPLCYVYDFSISDYSFIPTQFSDTWVGANRPNNGQGNAGQYSSGQWTGRNFNQQNSSTVHALQMFKAFTNPVDILNVVVYGTIDKGGGSSNSHFVEAIYSLTDTPAYKSTLVNIIQPNFVEGVDIEFEATTDDFGNYGIMVYVRTSVNSSDKGSIAIDRIEMLIEASSNVPDDSVAC